jgi:hypothetical protein
MSKLYSNIDFLENENIIADVEAELWASSSNIIARVFGAIARIFALLFGIKKKGYVILTNKRVIEVRQNISCWCFNTGKEVKYVLPNSVKEVGYVKVGTVCGCFCQAYSLYYDAFTQRTVIQLKGMHEEETVALVNTFYNTIQSAE